MVCFNLIKIKNILLSFTERKALLLLDIYNEDQSAYSEYETFCYQNNVRQILEYMKVKNAFAFINASLSFEVRKKNESDLFIYSKAGSNSLIPMAKDLIFRKDDERNIEDVWKDNIGMIESGYPLIITTDSYYIPYLPFYTKSHGRHCFIAAGFNENNLNPYVVDCCNTWYHKGEMDLNDFYMARSSKNEFDGGIFSGMSIGNNWAYIKKDGWDGFDSHDAVREILKLSYEQYNNDDFEDCLNGISAMKELLMWLDNLKTIDIEERKCKIRYLYNQLFWTIKRKNLFSFYIKKAIEENLLTKEYLVIAVKSKDLYEMWDLFLKFILKHSFIGKEQSINIIKDKLCEIMVLEEELVTLISSRITTN